MRIVEVLRAEQKTFKILTALYAYFVNKSKAS